MYSKLQLARKYLDYYFNSSNGKGHGTHSPFIYAFITKVLNDKKPFPEYAIVEKRRMDLLNDKTILSVEDFGAGSAVSKTKERTVASIAKNAAKSKKYGQLLFRMVQAYQPQTVLELGTSLGITSSYLSLANPGADIVTMEGAGEVMAIAKKNFYSLNLKNIRTVEGDFDLQLKPVLEGLPTVDFAFIDGNHRRLPAENYFRQILTKRNNGTILIFDDIHWSKEMEQVWQMVKNHPDVRCTIDLFFIGIVFFRKEFLEKQHFIIRF